MRGHQTEYILKGIYLGLLLFAARLTPDWATLGLLTLFTVGGLALGLLVAAVGKYREGFRVRGRWLPYLVFLLLDSPGLVYAGVLLGTAAGAFYLKPPADGVDWHFLTFVLGGAAVGVAFGLLRDVKHRMTRVGLSLALAAALVAGALALFGQFGDLGPRFQEMTLTAANPTVFGVQLLIGIPVFYLLTFVGRAEESEVEIGAMCAALGLAAVVLVTENPSLQPLQSLGFVVPVALYFLYTMRIMPGLRVFKHVLRGLSHFQLGQFRMSLLSLRRALQLDPNNALAAKSLWDVHRALDVNQLANDPKLLSLINLDLCLDRVGALLGARPTPEQMDEAHRLLDLVLSQRPDMAPRVRYWRTVAWTHARQLDRAAAELEALVDPSVNQPDDPQRQVTLVPAWQLALTLHEELRRRVGLPQLSLPGRRMEAIQALERHFAEVGEEPALWELKRLLYQDVTEAEYNEAAGGEGLAVAAFDHAYVQQLGLAQIHDAARWPRGGEYLRLAARGLPAAGVGLFVQIAEAHLRAGDADGARHNFELAKRAGRSVGAANLSEEDRQLYFNTVKRLAEEAQQRGDLDAAIENFHLYTESERSGRETLRALADLYERKGDALAALRATEQALRYLGADKDFTDRRDRYYYSVFPEQVQARLDAVRPWFDVSYCLTKAKSLLDAKNADLDLIDWALHLAKLALVVQPDSAVAKLLVARAHLRRGERDEAVALLAALRDPKPERFPSRDDEDAWYLGCRLLGDLYLDELARPDLAVACYQEYRKNPKSGADTLYKLGRAYEQVGDVARARRCFEQVTAYEGHPLAPDARDALYRLQTHS